MSPSSDVVFFFSTFFGSSFLAAGAAAGREPAPARAHAARTGRGGGDGKGTRVLGDLLGALGLLEGDLRSQRHGEHVLEAVGNAVRDRGWQRSKQGPRRGAAHAPTVGYLMASETAETFATPCRNLPSRSAGLMSSTAGE